jgi:cellulose synthase/poly-beta-1,6-N-acetylglucosamine synthase-like glycosyltransferase
VFTFLIDTYDAVRGAGPTVFMCFFVYVWLLWLAKSLAARRYRPSVGPASALTTTVIVPVYNEPEPIFRRALASVLANDPTEIIVVVDGGDPDVAAGARDDAARGIRVPH